MSLNRAIKSGKEHRKQYTGAKAADINCRNHGSCKWCHKNRIHKNEKRKLAAEQSQDDFIRLNEHLAEVNDGKVEWQESM